MPKLKKVDEVIKERLKVTIWKLWKVQAKNMAIRWHTRRLKERVKKVQKERILGI